MKKVVLLAGMILLGMAVVFFCAYFLATAPIHTGSFSVDQYAAYVRNQNFQTDRQYGAITDTFTAAQAGKTAITERFENATGGIWEWHGCHVQYDSEQDAYYVRTFRIAPMVNGGGYNVILRPDGTVLAIWGEK